MLRLLRLLPILVAGTAFAQPAPPPDLSAPPSQPAPVPPGPAPATPDLVNPLENPAPHVPPERAVIPPVEPVLPLAGYANGSFFLRDPHDWFVLFPKGRLQIDSYNFLNRGDPPPDGANQPDDKRPKNTIFLRRARAEVQGTFFRHFDYSIAGEFATTPAAGSYGTVTDCYVIVDYLTFLKFQAGQFDAPFTLENRTSDKFFDFMERSIAVRAFGVPQNKENGAMLFGYAPKKLGYYSIGLFNGDGQGFKNQDNYPLLLGRAFISPLGPIAKSRWMEDVWFGGSFWYQRNANLGGPIAPSTSTGTQNDLTNMTTQGGWTFFSSSNGIGVDSAGRPIRTHLAPAGDTVKWAVEANVPIKKAGARFELVHQSIDLGQYEDSAAATGGTSRAFLGQGRLDGTAFYLELFWWILGDVNFLESPGLEPPPHIRAFAAASEPFWGLMVAARYEHAAFDVTGLASGTDTRMSTDPALGTYSVDAFELGLNAWASKHIRITGNYVLNYISGDAKQVKSNLFFERPEHELLFRLAVAL